MSPYLSLSLSVSSTAYLTVEYLSVSSTCLTLQLSLQLSGPFTLTTQVFYDILHLLHATFPVPNDDYSSAVKSELFQKSKLDNT